MQVSGTKADGVDGLVSDALRREVEPLGVKVVVIEPGAVTTEMTERVAVTAERIISGMTTEQRGRYATLMHSVISQAQAFIDKGLAAEEAGRVVAGAITSKRPRARYTVGCVANQRVARWIAHGFRTKRRVFDAGGPVQPAK